MEQPIKELTVDELIEQVIKLLNQEGKGTKQEALKALKDYQKQRKVIND